MMTISLVGDLRRVLRPTRQCTPPEFSKPKKHYLENIKQGEVEVLMHKIIQNRHGQIIINCHLIIFFFRLLCLKFVVWVVTFAYLTWTTHRSIGQSESLARTKGLACSGAVTGNDLKKIVWSCIPVCHNWHKLIVIQAPSPAKNIHVIFFPIQAIT